MSTLLGFFWPMFAFALIVGLIAGLIGFHRKRPLTKGTHAGPMPAPPKTPHRLYAALGTGIAISLAGAAIWTGPLGAADRLTSQVERQAREALDYYEMPKVTAHLHRAPLTRRLVLAGGPLDVWQRGELARLFSQVPGVSRATWSDGEAGLPLIVESLIVSLLGFVFGLLLAYLVQLRRRYNAQWTW